jgi:uncharacterized integral membrane protein (TIGR00698 family)
MSNSPTQTTLATTSTMTEQPAEHRTEQSPQQTFEASTSVERPSFMHVPFRHYAVQRSVFWTGLALVAASYWFTAISPPVALALGLLVALTVSNPYPQASSKAVKWLLQISVVGLGFGINITSVVQASQVGFLFTVATITGTLLIGALLGRILHVRRKASHLIAVGTAICGGSAIAALAPVLEADEGEISVALGTVFVLNALALFLFPVLGAAFSLTQEQFGIWAAIAIHDTSSVVGAASRYGAEALATATTVKLSRALWIIPMTLGAAAWIHKRHQHHRHMLPTDQLSTEQSSVLPLSRRTLHLPYFVLWFLGASILVSVVPQAAILGGAIIPLAKTGLTVTLFLIGTGLSRALLASVGIKPFIQGLTLWILISLGALIAVTMLL